MQLKDIKIDPKIEARFKPLRPKQRKMLKKDITRHNCLHALVVWEETGILLDGYHRRAICMELGIEPPIKVMSFLNRKAALKWVDTLQAARRNLDSKELAALILRTYSRKLKKVKKAAKKSAGKGRGRPASKKDAVKATAEETGASEVDVKKTVESGKRRLRRQRRKKTALNKTDMSAFNSEPEEAENDNGHVVSFDMPFSLGQKLQDLRQGQETALQVLTRIITAAWKNRQ